MSQSKNRLIGIDVKTWEYKAPVNKPRKARYPAKLELRHRHWFFGGLLMLFCSWASFNSTASIDSASNNSISINPASQQPSKKIAVQADSPSPNTQIINYEIKHGDTLSTIFEKMGLPKMLPHNIAKDELGKKLKHISVGHTLHFELTKSLLTKITYALSALRNLEISIDPINNSLFAKEIDIQHNTVLRIASASIHDSLFLAASRAGISEMLIMDMAAIFGWDIDFSRDIRKGDRFNFIYEQHKKDEELLSEGNILAAQFINDGKTFSAIRFTDSNGDTSYYSADGKNMKSTFLKSPMKFSRISSGFSKRRYHPVLKKWRAHKGIDYAAATGTPIRTTANGKISFMGRKGGYGRVVIINHGGRYSTLYAHMSRFKKSLRTGSYVKQGQTIGYVGRSGLATGPHLHYEFRVNGVHRNYLTYRTPKSTPVLKQDMLRFKELAATQLAMLKSNIPSEAIASRSLTPNAKDSIIIAKSQY